MPGLSLTTYRNTFTASGVSKERARHKHHWELNYGNLEGNVLQTHIHFGQHGVNGGISVFLCTNLGNGPAGTPTCPGGSANLNGMIMSANVVGPAGQGLSAGEFDELVAAMRRGVTYVNVHSALWTAGEIRGQIKNGKR